MKSKLVRRKRLTDFSLKKVRYWQNIYGSFIAKNEFGDLRVQIHGLVEKQEKGIPHEHYRQQNKTQLRI